MPSHDTFNRVFSLIDINQLESALKFFVSESFDKLRKALKIPEPAMRQICVDGKASRGSGRRADTPSEIQDIQTLHVYSTEDGICLYSRQIDEKTNEIPVAQAILGTMDLKDTIVSFDAARAIRPHWQVESFHWFLDVMFNDDANMTVNRRASGNMSLLKKMILSLYKMMKPLEKVKSVSEIRRMFYWGYEEGIIRLLPASCVCPAAPCIICKPIKTDV